MTQVLPRLQSFFLNGPDAKAFLQSQLTMNAERITETAQLTAVCNLKGRVVFGLWVSSAEDGFNLKVHESLAADFKAHVNKYTAFSKATLTEGELTQISMEQGLAVFDPETGSTASLVEHFTPLIHAGNSAQFQPQELRLHELGGVDYNKGCYLGQEIVARLWFKGEPKQWLHCVSSEVPLDFDTLSAQGAALVLSSEDARSALVVARPSSLEGWQAETGGTLNPLPAGFSEVPKRS